MNSNPPTFQNNGNLETFPQSPDQQNNFPSSSDSRVKITEDYSKTFHRLLEEKETIIQDLFIENQRLSQNLQISQIPRGLSPKSLSPEILSPPKGINYKDF